LELRLHAAKVRKYLVPHDTITFGEKGETEGAPGAVAGGRGVPVRAEDVPGSGSGAGTTAAGRAGGDAVMSWQVSVMRSCG
jgi:hypothetical protein